MAEVDISKTKSLVDELDQFRNLRYPDQRFWGEGVGEGELHSGDFLVRIVREQISSSITARGIREIVSYQLGNSQLDLVKMFLEDNFEWRYWTKEFKGINKDIDSFIEKNISLRNRANTS